MPNTHENLTSLFSDIADSIRAKTGENRLLIADEFPGEIDAIQTGGGSAVINPITITANGTYTASSGVDGYSPVTVNVSQPTPPPIPSDIIWTRPSSYPDLDSLTYPDDANEMYFTIDRTKGSSSDYSFTIWKDNDNESLTFGHIENCVYVADTENLMTTYGTNIIDFSGYDSDILLGKFSYGETGNIQASTVSNPCIIESYVNWTGAKNNNKVQFIGENLKYIKFICYNNPTSPLSMDNRFDDCYSLQSIDFGNNFNASNITSMYFMFYNCKSLQYINFGNNFDTSNVTNMNHMFGNCLSLKTLDLSTFDTSNVTDMGQMFEYCYSLKSIDFGNDFDTSSVTTMNSMFNSCYSLQSLDLSNFDTSNVTDMGQMFGYCYSLKTLNLSTFDTSSATNMSNMFTYSYSLESIDFGNDFDLSSAESINNMFSYCYSLKSLDLNTFDTSNGVDISYLFYNCQTLQSIDFGNNFDTSNTTSMNNMFNNCKALQHRTFIDSMEMLPELTSTKTMKFGISKYKVEPEDIAIGTEKGWTITFAD